NVSVVLTDQSQSPPLLVSEQVKLRSTVHLFFYQPLPVSGQMTIPVSEDEPYPQPIPTPVPPGSPLELSVTINDADTNVPPLPQGLDLIFQTGGSGSGWLRMVLRHQPGVKDGTFEPGTTDLDVGFNV